MKIYIFPLNKFYKDNDVESFLSRLDNKSTACLCFNKFLPKYKKNVINIVKSSLISNKEREDVLGDYVSIIGEMSLLNGGHREWWATDISSKNRIISPMQEVINQIILSIKSIERYQDSDTNLCIIGVKPSTITFLKYFCNLRSIDIKINNEIFHRLCNMSKGLIADWINLFKDLLYSCVGVIRTRLIFNNVGRIDKNKPVFLIKSWVFPTSFFNGKEYSDPFCGSLALYLRDKLDKNMQVITISQGYREKNQDYKNMKNISDRAVFPIEEFLRLTDIIFAAISISWFLLFKPIKIPSFSYLLGHNISPAIKAILKLNGKGVRFKEYLYYYLGRRLASCYMIRTCIMSYEGNHWEKVFILGLRSINPNLEIIGYHHSVIPQAATGVFLGENEVLVTPTVNRIITSGMIPSAILKKYSAFSKDRIYSGCALLYQYLHSYKPFPRRDKKNLYTILVMLEGLMDTEILLKYVINQAKELQHIKFIIRSHPALPITFLLSKMGKNISELPLNIEVSYSKEITEDVKRCDVGLYWQTATSLEALMLGRPIIWFDRGDVLSLDPLFGFSEFKWTVQFETPLSSVLIKIKNLTNDEYNFRMQNGRKYVSKYFCQCNEKSLSYFIV